MPSGSTSPHLNMPDQVPILRSIQQPSKSSSRLCSPLPSPDTMGFRTESPHRSNPFLRPRIFVPVLLLIAILGLWLSRVQDHFNTEKLRFDKTSKLTQKVSPSSSDFSDIYNSTLGVSTILLHTLLLSLTMFPRLVREAVLSQSSLSHRQTRCF